MSGTGGTEGGDTGCVIRVLVSSCLLGEKVRYDGGHKREAFLVGTLGRFVEYVPVCPEVDCGLPTPREAMQLKGDPKAPRLETVKTGVDHTARMARWAAAKLRELESIDLCGYICKKGSPSSGMARIKVYGGPGLPAKAGAGMFTKAFMDRFPLVPVEEEGRLRDPVLREMFVERMFTLRRFRDLLRRRKTRRGLAAFHADHRLHLLSRGRTRAGEMERLVARSNGLSVEALYARYRRLLLEALARRAGPRSPSASSWNLDPVERALRDAVSRGEVRR